MTRLHRPALIVMTVLGVLLLVTGALIGFGVGLQVALSPLLVLFVLSLAVVLASRRRTKV